LNQSVICSSFPPQVDAGVRRRRYHVVAGRRRVNRHRLGGVHDLGESVVVNRAFGERFVVLAGREPHRQQHGRKQRPWRRGQRGHARGVAANGGRVGQRDGPGGIELDVQPAARIEQRRGRHRDRDIVQQPQRSREQWLPQREAQHCAPGHGRRGFWILQRPDRGVPQRAAEFVADGGAGPGALEGECVRVARRQVFAKRDVGKPRPAYRWWIGRYDRKLRPDGVEQRKRVGGCGS
jgi:hypothetical protein